MFTALFITDKKSRQRKCLSADEWINTWYSHPATAQMNPENITLRENCHHKRPCTG